MSAELASSCRPQRTRAVSRRVRVNRVYVLVWTIAGAMLLFG